jgi:hypothetical protein
MMAAMNEWVAAVGAASLVVLVLRWVGARPVRIQPSEAQLRVVPSLFAQLAGDAYLAAWLGIVVAALLVQVARGTWLGGVLCAALLVGLVGLLVLLRAQSAVVVDRGTDAIRVGFARVVRASAVTGVQLGPADSRAVALVVGEGIGDGVGDGMGDGAERLIDWPLPGVQPAAARALGRAAATYLQVPVFEAQEAGTVAGVCPAAAW